jgi:hypothetical protein
MIIDIFLTPTNIPLLSMEISRGYYPTLISRVDIQYPPVAIQMKPKWMPSTPQLTSAS